MKKLLLTTALILTALIGHLLTVQSNDGLGAKVTSTYLDDIETLHAKYGEYIQVTDDGRVLYKNTEVNEVQFKNKLPPNTVINVYDGPRGKGYQIVTNDGVDVTAIGFGPDAAIYTYSFSFNIASSSNSASSSIDAI